MRLAGHIKLMGGMKNAKEIFVEKFEGKRPLGRPRRRWEDNIKTDLKRIGCDVEQNHQA
jgi:hypothetical protein